MTHMFLSGSLVFLVVCFTNSQWMGDLVWYFGAEEARIKRKDTYGSGATLFQVIIPPWPGTEAFYSFLCLILLSKERLQLEFMALLCLDDIELWLGTVRALTSLGLVQELSDRLQMNMNDQ